MYFYTVYSLMTDLYRMFCIKCCDEFMRDLKKYEKSRYLRTIRILKIDRQKWLRIAILVNRWQSSFK